LIALISKAFENKKAAQSRPCGEIFMGLRNTVFSQYVGEPPCPGYTLNKGFVEKK
jgi:hypothetical protein